MAIRFFDMFAGIGGFRSGLEAVGGFECVGHCEIDKYANQAYSAIYDTKGECFFDDARTIEPGALPDIDLICGGFPCQSFSIAGKRRGFADDARGTLFFEIARIAAGKRPAFLLLENVPGLLSHDRGQTFAAILSTLDELGYDVAWQMLNSKDFGVPQSRKRVYIVGYLRGKCTGEVLSFTDTNGAALEVEEMDGRLLGRIDCHLKEPLTPGEMADLREEILGQCSDGLGEGFEQRPIETDEGDLYVSYWNSGDDYFLCTEDELEEHLEPHQGMGGI